MNEPSRKVSGKKGERGWTLLETMLALVVVGIGVGFYTKMQNLSSDRVRGNSNTLKAGQLIEKHVEALRINIVRDTIANWPPKDTTYTENGILMKRKVGKARSPKDNALVANVKLITLNASWGSGTLDSMVVITYVSKRF